jgi:hypothetical protein
LEAVSEKQANEATATRTLGMASNAYF